jgi:hypothetical protein
MSVRVIAVVGFVCFGAAASAIADTPPPPVDTMTCDQMLAELTVAGQKMNSQLDPEFAREAQAMANEAQGPSAGSMVGGVGSAIACSLPGIGMLCMAGMQAQAMAQGDQAGQNIERMQAQMERLQKAMEGLDQDRLTALSQRFEEQSCPVPQQQ